MRSFWLSAFPESKCGEAAPANLTASPTRRGHATTLPEASHLAIFCGRSTAKAGPFRHPHYTNFTNKNSDSCYSCNSWLKCFLWQVQTRPAECAISCPLTSENATTSSASSRKSTNPTALKPLETPAVENIETLLGKYGEEGNQLVFKILKRGEKLRQETGDGRQELRESDLSDLALRYDLTVPLARVVANNKNDLPKVLQTISDTACLAG